VSTDESEESPEPLGRCGSYELLVELAAGGMATVFLARTLGRGDSPLVAIKRPHRHLAKDKFFLTMLVDEARLASAIQHDHVVKVRELGFDSGEPFIVMDYVEGASLADVRKELSAIGRALDPRVAVRVALDSLAGLQAAHVLHDDQGKHLAIVHRDVSPHNILVGCDGLTRLTDFGIAKAADRVQVTQTHEVKGKLAYLAPERIDKRRLCTVQSDVFSMAVVLWECIAGRRLFRGEEAIETLQEVMTAQIPSLRRIGAPISQPLDDTILRGLSRDLDVRYKTAAEFAAALERAAGRQQLGTPAEVACLIEALFGERLRVRHEKIRNALGGPVEDAHRVLEVSGLNIRPAPTPEMREREKREIENIAPPAPSARYAFGATEGKRDQRFSSAKMRTPLFGGIAAALLVVGIYFGIRTPNETPKPATELTVRRVVVPLPFSATKVTFDDQSRDLNPAQDVASFDVPRESGMRHRVTAVGSDGSRAEAFVHEVDGIARAEGEGFVVETLDAYDDTVMELPATPVGNGKVKAVKKPRPPPPAPPKPPTPTASTPPAKPVSTVINKDGFTKLK
jgi:tRNA A-37 threonylcarbamoyl transferase component Bud32